MKFDYYLVVEPDNIVGVYVYADCTLYGTYSSLERCHALMLPWCIVHGYKMAALHQNTMYPLNDDDDWVMFRLMI